MLERFRHQFLGWWSRLIVRHPVLVLSVALAVTVACVVLTAARLEFQPDRNDLLSRTIAWNKTFVDWQSSFHGDSDLIVVVDSGPAANGDGAERRQRARALVDELGAELLSLGPAVLSEPFVNHVVWRFDLRTISPRMIRTLAWEDFERRLAELAASRTLLESGSLSAMVSRVVAQLNEAGRDGDAAVQGQVVRSLAGLDALVRAVTARAGNEGKEPDLGELVETSAEGRWQYLESDNGRLLFLRVSPSSQAGELNEFSRAIEGIRGAIARVAPKYPGIDLGLTGVIVMENDETEAATFDTAIASIVSFVLITVVLVLAFHSWTAPLLAMLSLAVGLAWTYGFVTISIGHLQVISVVIAPMLLGISDAYGVHLAAKLELVRRDYPDDADGFAAALQESFETMGPGILTGAATTAAAFGMTVLTDFLGVAEMGAAAAAGILLCLLAMFSVYPALLRLTKSRYRNIAQMGSRYVHFFEERWAMPFVRRPKLTLVVAGIATLGSLVAMSRMTYDYNLTRLMPRGFDSVRWHDRIVEDGGVSVWFGASVCKDMDELRARAAQVRAAGANEGSTLGSLGGMGILVPHDDDVKIRAIEAVRRQLEVPLRSALNRAAPSSPSAPARTQLLPQFNLLQLALRANVPADAPRDIRDALDALGASLAAATKAIQSLAPAEQSARLDRLDAEFAAWRQRTALRIDRALDPSLLTREDMPVELVRPFQDDRGRLQLEIHPALRSNGEREAGPLANDFLPRFIAEMEAIDPNVTGPAPQIYRSGKLILHSYLLSGIYALVVVFLLVWLDFRRLGDAMASLVPVAFGFAVTFGVMWLVGMPINPANIMVLPLMFGIGVDAGVHMIHRYRQDPVSRPPGLTAGTGKAITVTTLTTAVGFGTMIFASHRGISSLGFVLTVGITLSMFACWTIMPAWLELVSRRAQRREPKAR